MFDIAVSLNVRVRHRSERRSGIRCTSSQHLSFIVSMAMIVLVDRDRLPRLLGFSSFLLSEFVSSLWIKQVPLDGSRPKSIPAYSPTPPRQRTAQKQARTTRGRALEKDLAARPKVTLRPTLPLAAEMPSPAECIMLYNVDYE